MMDRTEFQTYYENFSGDNKSKMRRLVQYCTPTNQIRHTASRKRNVGNCDGYLIPGKSFARCLNGPTFVVAAEGPRLGSDAITMCISIELVDAHAAELRSNLLLQSLWILMSISADDDKLSDSDLALS